MIDCDFGFGGDDCLNAHDCSLFMRPSGKRTMRTVNGRSIWTIAKGDKVEIRQGDYSPSGMQAIVADIKQIDAKIKFTKSLSTEIYQKKNSTALYYSTWTTRRAT